MMGVVGLAVFLLIGAAASLLGRLAGVDPDGMPFSEAAGTDTADNVSGSVSDTTSSTRVGFLPREIRESSGIARSGHGEDVWWTHNDGNDGRVFALSANGTLLGTWRLEGARVTDVEDIASAPCPDRESSPCLYLADIGDNQGNRSEYAVQVVREPRAGAGSSSGGVLEPVAVLRFSYGGSSHDAEALAVMRDGTLLVITKSDRADVFGLPRPDPANTDVVEAESLGPLPLDIDRKEAHVTAAAVSPSGTRLAVRSDVDIALFDLPDRRFVKRCNVSGQGQQGEAVDFQDETTLMLTSEAAGGRAPLVRIRCE